MRLEQGGTRRRGEGARAQWPSWWPWITAVLLWLGMAAWTGLQIRRETGGAPIYASDDICIHMAMAKNVVRDGVWRVTPYGFTSSASSRVWLVLLAATYVLFGVNNWSPLAGDGAKRRPQGRHVAVSNGS